MDTDEAGAVVYVEPMRQDLKKPSVEIGTVMPEMAWLPLEVEQMTAALMDVALVVVVLVNVVLMVVMLL